MTTEHEPKAPRAPIDSGAPIETADRATVVVHPGLFLTLVIASALGAGGVIYWLLRSMHI